MEKKPDIVGTWINEMGSSLRIDTHSPDGRIAGTFKPAKGAGSAGKEHALIGFWHKEKRLISFSVLFDNSIVTWMGNFTPENTLEATWVMQKTDAWDGKMTGYNHFKLKQT